MSLAERLAEDPDLVERAGAELSRRRLGLCARRHWHVEHGEGEPLWGWHLDAICEHLEALARGDLSRLLIAIPPGFAKSLFASVYFPSWVWKRRAGAGRTLLDLGPAAKFLVISGAADVALRDAMRHRELVESERYRRDLDLLGVDWSLEKRQNAKGFFQTTAKGSRMSRAAGQKITGLRGHCIIVDDLLDAREAMKDSSLIAERNRWFDEALFSRKQLGADVPIVNIQQRLHDGDLHGHLTRRGGWHSLVIEEPKSDEPELSNTPLDVPDPRQPGEHLDPRLLSAEDYAELEATLGPDAVSAQYGQRPSAADGSVFLRERFRYWQSLPDRRPDLVVVSGDMTFKRSKDSNFCVGQVWLVFGADRYLVAQFRQRMGLPEAKTSFLSMVERTTQRFGRVDAVLIENTANGPAVIEHLQRTTPVAVIPIQPTTKSKLERAQLASISFAGGQVWFPRESWVPRILEPELLAFPRGIYDDQVDALSQALVWINETARLPFSATL